MKRTTKRLAWATLLTSFSISYAFGALKVVDDAGGSSAEPYYEQLNPEPDTSQEPKARPHSGPVTEADMLPILSPSISPGQVLSRQINAPGLRPFFIVGDDDLSRAWLVSRKDALVAMGAVGMVVNVQTVNELQTLRQLGTGLTMLPTPGGDVAKRLALDHYPALVTSQSIEQ
ncbi:integrating conjugative element protein [Pseudomonas caricapapayae]|uniref:integrating conjugative element protein n=1 Tax=Pseudomonas caricapapayae TaxID=46678 RepID=UPI000EFF0AC2|nr:integrating conjugative element protein [Pseudomonas caricapapayae]